MVHGLISRDLGKVIWHRYSNFVTDYYRWQTIWIRVKGNEISMLTYEDARLTSSSSEEYDQHWLTWNVALGEGDCGLDTNIKDDESLALKMKIENDSKVDDRVQRLLKVYFQLDDSRMPVDDLNKSLIARGLKPVLKYRDALDGHLRFTDQGMTLEEFITQ
jgi:hypothetical protein